MTSGDKLTFWEMLNNYDSIEIPVIQRDYAQGRSSNEIKDIRNNFINAIKESLLNRTLMDLNFVYGSSVNKSFIPIDGQQRLTTLFLLHLYFILTTNSDLSSEEYRRIGKFRYKTRASSNDFCERITTKEIAVSDKIELRKYGLIRREIENNSWFSSSWINDPTIDSMLNMLDTIHDAFRDTDHKALLDLLCDKDECPIYFYFLELDKYSLDDSIYVKLNARGKVLTDFENFKAKLSKFLDNKSIDSNNYIPKFDDSWAKVFWTYHDTQSFLYDDKIMNFIRTFIINEYASDMTQTGRDAVRAEIKELIEYTDLEFINRFHSFSDKLNSLTIEESFVKLFDLFDLIADDKDIKSFAGENKYIDEKQLFKWIINGKESEKGENRNTISYTTRVQAYAYYGYLLHNSGKIDADKLTEWLRVIRTLSRETNYNGGDDFVRAIKGVKRLLPHSSDIVNYLAAIDDTRGYGFDIDCFEEECAKANLIIKSDDWRRIILDAESNPYFDGQIGFLLEFAKIDEAYKDKSIRSWNTETSNSFFASFKSYKEMMCTLFGEFISGSNTYKGLNREYANAFRRAILSKGDFSLSTSANKSFLIDNHRDISWKRLLRIQRNDPSYKMKRSYLLRVLDDIDFDSKNIVASCKKICSKELASIKQDDFRYYFVKESKLMDRLYQYGTYSVERYFRIESGYIFLMGSSRLYGYNDEYYSYALYCMLEGIVGAKAKYNQAKGWDDIEAHINIKLANMSEEVQIKYMRGIKKFWLFTASTESTPKEFNTPEEVFEYIEKL